MACQGRRSSIRRRRRRTVVAVLAASIAALVIQSAVASAAPIRVGHKKELITAHQGGYGSDPSSVGPTVSVNVANAGGRKGYIEVWARVRSNVNQTAVGLFDVTGGRRRFVRGQDTLCSTLANVPLPGDLFMTLDGVAGFYGTPMTVNFGGCSPTTGSPGPVLFHVPAGIRTFRLEYADCGCGGTARVANRWLWIRRVPAS
jgi:hypothetical protein